MKLYDVAHARAGDKGDTSDVTVLAYRAEDYAQLCQVVTAEAVERHLGHPVERYELPTLHAIKLVVRGALTGGVTRSLALDAHGKSMSSVLLELEVPWILGVGQPD